MTGLLLAAIVFAALHIGVSGTALRGVLVARLGANAYRAGFSILSALGIVWLVLAYRAAPYMPSWGLLGGMWRWVMLIGMLVAFLLAVAGLATPNPTAVGQEARAARPAQGIVRITRHPFLTGVALWALLHLVGNGDLASLVLFGSLFLVCVLGTRSIDAKRRHLLGSDTWDAFARQTSILPFAAILAGRNHLVWQEIGTWRIALGVLAWVLMLGAHAHVIGMSPFP